MIIRFGYSWRLRFERIMWAAHYGFGFRGFFPGFRFERYEPDGIDWRKWYIKLGTSRIVLEHPSSDKDSERLIALLKQMS
jgi:hypothetical protein